MTQTTLREYLRATEDAISSGRIEEAMANCQNILTYFPEALEAQRLLGEVYLAQGQLEEAKQTFEWILTNDPENVIVYCDRALISERSSDIDTALDCYQQAYELSRGNANIRQEFNQLSARAGQPEFMFSRAGLARLYMRGDLLTQAIQEWDAVLAISPERLDARLGLMETYWREGKYDKVEAIATQLLEEIPTCLKALLLLAHVTSISNIQRAQELLLRAESLDPELTMAQEIFADLAASQPNDPFLELIRKEAIVLEDGVPVNLQQANIPVAVTSQAQVEQKTSPSSPYEKWEVLEKWDQPTQADSLLSEALVGSEKQENPQATTQHTPPWYQADQLASADVSAQRWNSPENPQPAQTEWDSEEQEDQPPAPPAWLDSLTRSERSQMGEEVPMQAAAPSPNLEMYAAPKPVEQKQVKPEDVMPLFFAGSEESDDDRNWPEWLKSLGAEVLEPEQQTPSEQLPEIEPMPDQPGPESSPWEAERLMDQPSSEADPWAALPSMSATNDGWASSGEQPDWMQQLAGSQEPASTPDWMQQLSQTGSQPYQEPDAATPMGRTVAEQEQRYIASLEELERNLQSQGFTPLAPGSLASIAATQSQSTPQAEPLHPSALAQLGNFSQGSPETGDPWWATGTPVARGSAPAIPQTAGEPADPFAALGARPEKEITQPMPALPATPAPSVASQAPASSLDALIDSDLETTMRRPAITFQSIQANADVGDRLYSHSKSRNERRPAQASDDNSLSSHERLVKGYQYQLSGAYDEAMQEYRVIIRNAPELLDDVISNMRALLKINPRFSLGHRVLGDAYMRKGEYLQAMESYNKALTMAKKARN
ncbi:MAG TPA: tetratricopeptide repeat protein [Ktedonobacteraceae bacterium]|nr:tetratricopeptide repeat protein [Ktedonobacteraceae bacterium]